MFKLLSPRQRTILGVDISSTSVKIIELSSNGNQYSVEGYGAIKLPENAMEGPIVKDVDAVSNAIRSLLAQTRLSSRKVAVAVPDSLAISRTIQVHEGLSEDEIEELVIIEADKYIPYPIDEINIDFNVIGPSAKNTAMQDVLIVASRTENVSKRVETVSHAGLEAVIVDVESYAIERVAHLFAPDLPTEGENKVIAIIDVGAVYTHFFVLSGMKIIFSREEEFGGVRLIQAIMEKYGLGAEEAEKSLREGTLPSDYVDEVLQPFIELILLQIKRGLQVFFSSTHYTVVDYILLAGGVAKVPDLARLLQEHINIPTQIANPFKYMNVAKKINQDQLYKDSPTLLVACGLALRASEKK
ncbi:type IV pilus assembly protein PilM [Legionella impletisoli]|uniref:Pilus assembly protein PilM n=1 Tax=Legionella impletisoli TaxID=343510 RepID=A0A917JXH5_9GAMM|nr:type IV pilus assembly protein PilM [Legionella impletisoli]GGI91165.1 pilus assembly protein PilM [Legionella impletisoli]